jgi:hypothetical protein
MSVRNRAGWKNHIEQIIRSQHYTWIGEGLGGEPLAEALIDMMADIMQICAHQGMSWKQLVDRSRAKFEREEAAVVHEGVASSQQPTT